MILTSFATAVGIVLFVLALKPVIVAIALFAIEMGKMSFSDSLHLGFSYTFPDKRICWIYLGVIMFAWVYIMADKSMSVM